MSSQQPATNPYRTPEPPEHDGEQRAGARRRRTGTILAIGTVIVVLLAVFGVTGFAYPGWFLDTEETKHPPRPELSKPSGPRDGGKTAEGTTNTALDYLNSGDLDGFGTLTCPNAEDPMLRAIDAYDPRLTAGSSKDVDKIQVDYALEDVSMRGPEHAVASISENFDNLPKSYDRLIPQDRFNGKINLERQHGKWRLCEINFTVPGERDQPAEEPASPVQPTS